MIDPIERLPMQVQTLSSIRPSLASCLLVAWRGWKARCESIGSPWGWNAPKDPSPTINEVEMEVSISGMGSWGN